MATLAVREGVPCPACRTAGRSDGLGSLSWERVLIGRSHPPRLSVEFRMPTIVMDLDGTLTLDDAELPYAERQPN